MANRMGRMPGGIGLGPGGSCICTNCGYRKPHIAGNPCYNSKCPKCNTPLARE